MQASSDPKQFEREWFEIAQKICIRIFVVPEIQAMKEGLQKGNKLTRDEHSNFIAIANRVKYEVLHELFGPPESDEFKKFRDAWRHWFDHKGVPRFQQENRRLTNAEHIIYSSTPDPTEFLSNS